MEKKKILIVEDEAVLRALLSESFEEEGFAVLEAEDGEAGLEFAFTYKPDMILLDILMPRMDGLTALKKLREDDWGKYVPIILLTNLPVDKGVVKGIIDSPPLYYLDKSTRTLEDIVGRVKAQLAAA